MYPATSYFAQASDASSRRAVQLNGRRALSLGRPTLAVTPYYRSLPARRDSADYFDRTVYMISRRAVQLNGRRALSLDRPTLASTPCHLPFPIVAAWPSNLNTRPLSPSRPI